LVEESNQKVKSLRATALVQGHGAFHPTPYGYVALAPKYQSIHRWAYGLGTSVLDTLNTHLPATSTETYVISSIFFISRGHCITAAYNNSI